MNDLTFLKSQVVQLRNLLKLAQNDPVMQPQLQRRLQYAEKRLAETEPEPGNLFPVAICELPRVALFLTGAAVQGQSGIRPGLAGQTLIQYDMMFRQQALHDERVLARTAGRIRRPRGSREPELLFTGTPRGSFGLEFTPQAAADGTANDLHVQALEHVADALARITGSDAEESSDLTGGIPPGVLPPLKRFLSALAQHDAEIRLAFSDKPGRTLTAASIKKAAQRLDRDIAIEPLEVIGVFRGLTLDTGHFDFRTDDNNTISGMLADQLTDEEIEQIVPLANKRCMATLQKTIVTGLSNSPSLRYVLEKCEEQPE